jgi:hypothetical protein
MHLPLFFIGTVFVDVLGNMGVVGGRGRSYEDGHGGKRGHAMEGRIKRVITGLQTICRCFSVAIRQAGESEIDSPSARRFRRLYEPAVAPFGNAQEKDPGMKELTTRIGVGLRTFRNCCAQANLQARQSEFDIPARRRFRELSMQGMLSAGAAPDIGENSERTQTGAVPGVEDFPGKSLEELRSSGTGIGGSVIEGKEGSAGDRSTQHMKGTDSSLELVS